MKDALEAAAAPGDVRPRQSFVLQETDFIEVPKRFRRLYRRWRGAGDVLAPNEILCPVCKVVIRSTKELRVGDRVYCMPCMSRLEIVEQGGKLIGRVIYGDAGAET